MNKSKENHNPHLFQVSLKLILKNKKGEILALQLPKTSSMAGYYDLPGGRINSEEIEISPEKIIKRESLEEIGKVKYSLKKPVSVGWHSYISSKSGKEKHVLFVFFEADYLSGKIKLSKEHIDCEWIKLNKKNVSKYFTMGLLKGMENYLS
jgi:8-oxo-dGTP pyrophosphatase MutT (NUDIX family)